MKACGLFLLHFDPPYQHARHYLGYAKRAPDDYARRVASGVAWPPHGLVMAALSNFSEVSIGGVWPGLDRNDRRAMRASHDLSRYCHLCL